MNAKNLALVLLPACLLAACNTPGSATPTEAPVNAASNDGFMDPEVDVDAMVQRFEVESREIAAQRDRITEAIGLREGMAVADIGAGTGLFLEPFAARVGRAGTVYAVDISPAFVEHMQKRAADLGLPQVEAVLCTDRSVELPANSVNVAFICDVYHHFEYPRSSMASVYRALRPGGTLVVVDFERDESIRNGWALEHIRAPKEVFRAEIEEVGFEFVEEVPIEGLSDNYFLRFRKR